MTPPTLPKQLEFPTLCIKLHEFSEQGIRITEHGVILDPGLPFEEYCEGLRAIKNLHSRSKLVLADYIRQGKIQYGDIAVENAMGQLEFDMPTVNAILSINSVPASLREHNLEADHYVVLAKADITPREREKWAATAAEQNLTASTLKASINAGEVQTPAQAKSKNHGIASPHGLRAEGEIWFRRVDGIKGILRMGDDYVADIIRELGFFADIVAELKEKLEARK